MKRRCPITREEFHEHSPDGQQVMHAISESILLKQKEFSTGSFGYAGTGKIGVLVADTLVQCQVSVVATVVDSKHAE